MSELKNIEEVLNFIFSEWYKTDFDNYQVKININEDESIPKELRKILPYINYLNPYSENN